MVSEGRIIAALRATDNALKICEERRETLLRERAKLEALLKTFTDVKG